MYQLTERESRQIAAENSSSLRRSDGKKGPTCKEIKNGFVHVLCAVKKKHLTILVLKYMRSILFRPATTNMLKIWRSNVSATYFVISKIKAEAQNRVA